MKTVWNSIESEMGKMVRSEDIHKLNIAGYTTYDCWVILDSFNNHFISVVEKINNVIVKGNSNLLDYISQGFNSPFANIKYKCHQPKKLKKLLNQ
jgi:hypothetical protein